MPDIDIDFDSEKRDFIIEYVRNKYGNASVAVGLTYNTYKAKLILRELGKLFKVDSYLLDKFIREIDRFSSLKNNYNNVNVKKYLDSYKELSILYKVAMKLENIKKNISTHAAGICICDDEIDNNVPVYVNDAGEYKTGIPMEYLEDKGILKMDFLGLKNLTLISNILNEIGYDKLNDINLNDEKVIDVFKIYNTDGIFQYETFAMKALLKKLEPTNFDEIIAAVALVRPGPSSFLDQYISNRNNPDKIKYISNDLKDILSETYGIILYQEQIIKILVRVGGFSLANADIVRRAISKKKNDLIVKSRDKFINGAISNGYTKDISIEIFDRIEKFANYGFNKSHSVAYALIGYQMAYLKVYYQSYFINECLKDTKDVSKIDNYLRELKNNGIKIIKPDINYSTSDFVIKNNQLILPLTMIKGVNKVIVDEIINNRPYKDYFDFYTLNKDIKSEVLDNLIYSNSLRSLNLYIKTLIESREIVKNYALLGGNLEKPLLNNNEEYDINFMHSKELELFGFYVGNHPSSKYKDRSILKIKDIYNNLFKDVTMVVVVDKVTKIKTKKGDDMAFISFNDETGKSEGVVFSTSFGLVKDINKNDLIEVKGKISKSQDKINVIINGIEKI